MVSKDTPDLGRRLPVYEPSRRGPPLWLRLLVVLAMALVLVAVAGVVTYLIMHALHA